MESRYSVRWVRRSGQTVPIEAMSDVELAGARHLLEREDPIDPVAAALFEAVVDELARRSGEPAVMDAIEESARRKAA